jgi:hypothetical protein
MDPQSVDVFRHHALTLLRNRGPSRQPEREAAVRRFVGLLPRLAAVMDAYLAPGHEPVCIVFIFGFGTPDTIYKTRFVTRETFMSPHSGGHTDISRGFAVHESGTRETWMNNVRHDLYRFNNRFMEFNAMIEEMCNVMFEDA